MIVYLAVVAGLLVLTIFANLATRRRPLTEKEWIEFEKHYHMNRLNRINPK